MLGRRTSRVKRNTSRMVGIFSWFGISQEFEQRIKAIKKAGFDSTSIWIDEDGHWEIDQNDIPRIIKDNGLILDYAHAPYQNINILWDQYKSQELGHEIEKYIRYCSLHEIPILVIHLTKGFKVKEANEYGLNVLKIIVEYAKDRKVQIAVENTKQNNVLDRVLSVIEDKTLGLCFDTSHDNLYSDQKFSILKKYQDRLLCLHISDNDGLSDDHWIPYRGKIDWEEFIEKFPREYQGILNLEILPKEKTTNSDYLLVGAYMVIKKIELSIQKNRSVTA